MHIRPFILALIIAFVLPVGVASAGNPIPGVGIVVRRNPGTNTWLVVPGGFFGPGSEPFEGSVGLEGRCSHDCGGCDDECAGRENDPDGRIDYAADVATGPFDVIMESTVLYSDAPIAVSVDGVVTYLDVFMTISGQAAPLDDPILGMLLLSSGQSLEMGTSPSVYYSLLAVHSRVTFADASTGVAVGSAIEREWVLQLQDSSLPITRVADGTPEGYIVLGLAGSITIPFHYASPDGEFLMMMRSLNEPATVPVKESTWGAVKGRYR